MRFALQYTNMEDSQFLITWIQSPTRSAHGGAVHTLGQNASLPLLRQSPCFSKGLRLLREGPRRCTLVEPRRNDLENDAEPAHTPAVLSQPLASFRECHFLASPC